MITVFVAEVAFGIFAVYLSWTSNALIGWSTFPRVVFAIFAFLFGFNYAITHLINKLDMVMYIRKLHQAGVVARQPYPPLPPPPAAASASMYGGRRGVRRS